MNIETKIMENFASATACKNKNSATLASFLDLPSEVKQWVLKKFTNSKGIVDAFSMSEYVKEMRMKPDEFNIRLLEARHSKKGTFSLLTKVKIEFDYANDQICFSLPEYNFPKKAGEAVIDWSIVSDNKKFLLTPNGAWGTAILQCDCGLVNLISFTPMCPYDFNLKEYRKGRKNFSTEEWIDVLLGGLNFNPKGFDSQEQKLVLLQRFLPFVEKRLNSIELSIKGSAKSYCYSQLSPYNWLTSGAISRSSAFYNMTTKKTGYFVSSSQVIFDEVQTMSCAKPDELLSCLKGYLENGTINVGSYCGTADAGLTLVGNIPNDSMNIYKDNLFKTLPKFLSKESPLLDRFSYIIDGKKIGRFTTEREMDGISINSDYLTEIFHLLREEFFYRAIIDELVQFEEKADKRNVEHVKKTCTAYLKLLFPHITNAYEVDKEEFEEYCLKPAIKGREAVLAQLRLIDDEYKNVSMPHFFIK